MYNYLQLSNRKCWDWRKKPISPILHLTWKLDILVRISRNYLYALGIQSWKRKNYVHDFLSFFLWLENFWLICPFDSSSLISCFFLLINLEISMKFMLNSSCTREGAMDYIVTVELYTFYSTEKGGFENARKAVRCLGTVLLWNLTFILKYFVLLLF